MKVGDGVCVPTGLIYNLAWSPTVPTKLQGGKMDEIEAGTTKIRLFLGSPLTRESQRAVKVVPSQNGVWGQLSRCWVTRQM